MTATLDAGEPLGSPDTAGGDTSPNAVPRSLITEPAATATATPEAATAPEDGRALPDGAAPPPEEATGESQPPTSVLATPAAEAVEVVEDTHASAEVVEEEQPAAATSCAPEDDTTRLIPKPTTDHNARAGAPQWTRRRPPNLPASRPEGHPAREPGLARPVTTPRSSTIRPPLAPPPVLGPPVPPRPTAWPMPTPGPFPSGSAGRVPPHRPEPRRPGPPRPIAAPARSAVPARRQPENQQGRPGPAGATRKQSDALTLSKVLGGGMAAATSAVLGSSLGAFGTVGGAAAGSIASIVITWLCERSIERAQKKVSSTVKLSGDTDSRQHSSRASLDAAKTERLSPGGNSRSGWQRRGRRLAVGALMIFLVGLALVTGIEWAKGSPLSGGAGGTSVGRVLRAAPPPTTPPVAGARADQQRHQHDANGGEATRDNAVRDSGTDADEKRTDDSRHSDQDNRDQDNRDQDHREDSDADSPDEGSGDGGSGDISSQLTPADPPNPQGKVLGVLPSSPDSGHGIGVLPRPDQGQPRWSEPTQRGSD
ncbi:MAG TPA: hypothetical protein VGM60_14060 [Pseudonocardia sp.]|uniref:hypothetical protein n=1 Tax=Pseudonocardia sp. TaxID=60912 RepID=UPI002F40A520